MAGRRPLRQSMGDAPDERLLIEAAQRDNARFADLYELYFDRVYAYVVRRVFDRSDAEDLTSEVFHHALANLGRFEWRAGPVAPRAVLRPGQATSRPPRAPAPARREANNPP